MKLRIPAHLAATLPDGERPAGWPPTVSLSDGSWSDLVAQVRERLPRLAERVLTQSGSIRAGFVLVVNADVVRAPDANRDFESGDEICVLAAIAGG